MKFDYKYGSNGDNFTNDNYTYFQFPKVLLSEAFSALTIFARVLFCVLLDRMRLSQTNSWVDGENRVYIFFSIKNVMKTMNVSKKTAIRHMNELEQFGLLEKQRRGMGKVNKLYVKNFMRCKNKGFDYYYGLDGENYAKDNYTYFQFPKVLLSEDFSALTILARVLLCMLLDRMRLSQKNSWIDERNQFYIYYSIKDVKEELNVSKSTAIRLMNELEEFGLLEKHRRDQGRGNKLYVNSRMIGSATKIEPSRGVEADTSEESIMIPCKASEPPLKVSELSPINKTTFNNNEAIIESDHTKVEPTEKTDLKLNRLDNVDEVTKLDCINLIRENICYDALLNNHPVDGEMIDGIVDLIVETIISQKAKIKVAGDFYPTEVVRNKFLRLDFHHIEYVLECFNRNTTEVRNIKNYLLTCLFNAPSTIAAHYKAAVNHDMSWLNDRK